MLHILLFSHDKTLFKEGSESQERMKERGKICSGLVILVPTQEGFSETRLAPNVRAIPTNSQSRLRSFFDLKRIAGRVMKDEPINLIISQDPFEFGWIAAGLGKTHDIPVQVELHGDFYSTGYWKWSSPMNFMRYWMGLRVLKKTHCIRVVSERLRIALRERLNISDSRISVFPVEAQAEKYLAAPRSSFLKEQYGNFDFFLLTVGVLNPVKNIGMQIRALCDVARHYPKTALVIVGSGPERKVLEILASKLRILQNVIFAGAQQDLAPYYMSADAFLFTSHAEGWGRAAVEAMASGLAVAMTDVGLAGDLLINGKNGIVVARKDERALVRAIGELRKDAGLRERLGAEARRTVLALPSHEEVLKRYKESWEDCLKRV